MRYNNNKNIKNAKLNFWLLKRNTNWYVKKYSGRDLLNESFNKKFFSLIIERFCKKCYQINKMFEYN